MLLELVRYQAVELSILGRLTVDGSFECWTLECTTVSIPVGVYTVEMTYSPKFQRPMPLVDRVPGRSAIRIHPGNSVEDTEGCILVGNGHTDTTLTNSRAASDSLNDKILSAIKAGEQVTLAISF